MTEDWARIGAIQTYWNEQGKKYAADLRATNPDPLAKELELSALRRVLNPARDTLEAGCGNGYNLFRLREYLCGRIAGFDYAEALIDAARAEHIRTGSDARITFHMASILDDLGFLGVFPQIFTDRCLINLPSLDLQIEALRRLAAILITGGLLVCIESTRQGQERLNDLREQAGLHRIPYHWHNLYLDEDTFLARLPQELRLVKVDDFSSLYFVISRVFNARLTPPGQEPDYLSEINRVAAALPSMGDYGPLKMFVFEKTE